MAISKVVYGASVLVDLTEDTVKPDALRTGYSAHGADGREVTGTLSTAALEKYVDDYNIGYVDTGRWIYQNPTNTFSDIYQVESGHTYYITLGARVGSRFRVMFTTRDVTEITSAETVVGTAVLNRNNPTGYMNVSYTPEEDGYLIVAKDNVGVSGIGSYVYDKDTAWQ